MATKSAYGLCVNNWIHGPTQKDIQDAFNLAERDAKSSGKKSGPGEVRHRRRLASNSRRPTKLSYTAPCS
jgi:hypothetical protein